nr:MAG TPA: Endodeoxyribonuclease RusA [Caudoviricetes sp.]
MVIEFFMPMLPPTITHQQHKVKTVNGKPVFYDPPELKDARQKLTANLIPNIPEQPFTAAVRLTTKWLFPKGQHKNGEWKTTKPDTDNMIKLLKDCMTVCRFWKDDALVVSEITEKFWADIPGIYVRIEEL